MWMSSCIAGDLEKPASQMILKSCVPAAFLAMPFNGGMFGLIYIVNALKKHATPTLEQAPHKLSRQELRHPQKSAKAKKAS